MFTPASWFITLQKHTHTSLHHYIIVSNTANHIKKSTSGSFHGHLFPDYKLFVQTSVSKVITCTDLSANE